MNDDAINVSIWIHVRRTFSLLSVKSAPRVNKRPNQTTKQASANLWRLLDSAVSCAKKPFDATKPTRFSVSSFIRTELQQTTLLQQRHAGALPSCTAEDAADDNLKHRTDQPTDSTSTLKRTDFLHNMTTGFTGGYNIGLHVEF